MHSIEHEYAPKYFENTWLKNNDNNWIALMHRLIGASPASSAALSTASAASQPGDTVLLGI